MIKTFEKPAPSLPKADYRVSFGQGAAYAAGMIMVNLLASAISSVLKKKKEQQENGEVDFASEACKYHDYC